MHTTHARFAKTILNLAFFDDAKASNIQNFLQAAATERNGKLSNYQLESLTRPGQLKTTSESAKVLLRNKVTPFEIGQKMSQSIFGSTEEEAKITEKALDFAIQIKKSHRIITVLFTIMYDGSMRVVLMEAFETPLKNSDKIIAS